MKQYVRFVLLSFCLLPLSLWAGGDKVVDASARRKPKWLGGTEEGYIITSAQADNLEQAKDLAMIKVREEVLASIATQVSSSTSIELYEQTANGVSNSTKTMLSTIDIHAADVPYLTDISVTHIEASHWMKCRRKDKSVYFSYHIKYPFSKSKLRLLVMDYEARQKAINDTLQSFASVDFALLGSVEEMISIVNDLDMWAKTLPSYDHRHELCNAVRTNYLRMLDNLQIVLTEQTPQRAVLVMRYADHNVACSVRPKLKSDCLTELHTENMDVEDIVSYNFTNGCYEEDGAELLVTYPVLNKKIKGVFIIRD